MGRWLAVVVVSTLVVGHRAEACPPGRPCRKYDARIPTTQYESPDRYVRSTKGAPPAFDRKRVARFLITGTWKPTYDRPSTAAAPRPMVAGQPQIIRETDTLRFVDPTKPIPDARPGERIVLVRYVERNKGRTLIDVDGEIFWLRPCAPRKDRGCLVPSELGLPEVDPEHPPTPVFGPMPVSGE